MTKEEFLDGLRKALASTGSQALIEENTRLMKTIQEQLMKKITVTLMTEKIMYLRHITFRVTD